MLVATTFTSLQPAGFLLGLLFVPEVAGGMFFLNVG
jgi:hypothetical protein